MASMHWLPLAILALVPAASAQTVETPDITKDPTLFVVPYAHLDTQWRWNFPQTISEFLLKTMRVNFDLIDKYPHYVFNWTGANRYRLMKEYYPADYARMKQYIAAGRWYPAGSSVEEGDVNLPNAESIFRQILYGNDYFRREFGKASAEYMLPDCFGFPASLPSILAAAGIKGFSTQKLNSNWQPAPQVGGPDSPEHTPEGIPFNVGRWEGPDGSTIVAALNPGSYSAGIRSDLTLSPPPPPVETGGRGGRGARPEEDWVKRIALDGQVSGVFADYHYIGTGDTGGAVNEDSVKLLETMTLETEHATGAELHVIPSTADQMFLSINDQMKAHLPEYKGDLELINHSAGSLTSEAYHKRWNRRNEVLADMAEKASVAAAWMGGLPYPKQRLNNAWMLVLGGQFHDTGAGTATPQAYEFAQNDDVIAMNQFAGVITSATRAVAAQLNTEGPGVPLVVYNSLNTPRQDVVEAAVDFPGGMPKAVRVLGPDGRSVPAQIENGKVVFVARVPSVGYATYFAEPINSTAANAAPNSELKVTENSLENAHYRVKIDENGDISSIFDKRDNKELLAAPMRLAISTDAPHQWPAWNMDFDQEQAAPRAYVGGAVKVRISENGPARVALEMSRETEGSKFVQTVSLAAGDAGDHVEFHEAIDWRTLSANLKAVFPLTATNRMATYNWDVGTIQRPTAYDRQFEVASHQWIDLTDESGSYGATILTGTKNGSDKRDDHTIRLTLIRTPGAREEDPVGPRGRSYTDQFNQDWGHHEITFGIAGHTADWRAARTDWEGYRLNAPLAVFETTRHAGTLGRSFSLVRVSDPAIRVLALKQAESGDEVIVRLVETHGAPASNVLVKFAGPVTEAREVNAQEQPLGAAKVSDSALEASFTAYQPRTFALRLGAPPARLTAIRSQAVDLRYDHAVSSNDDTKTIGGFDEKGDAIPAEMLPEEINFHGVVFHLAPSGTGKLDAMTAHGQVIALPPGFHQVYVLAASDDADQNARFRVGSQPVQFDIENWTGFVGQWDTRLWKAPPATIAGRGGREMKVRTDWSFSANHSTWTAGQDSPSWSPRYPEDYLGLKPGFIKPAEVAWYASHHHTADGLNEPYEYSYLFAYAANLPGGATSLTLPDNSKIRVLAVSVAATGPALKPVAPLYDSLEPHP